MADPVSLIIRDSPPPTAPAPAAGDRFGWSAERRAAAETFLTGSGWAMADLTPLAADASFRRYFRLIRGGRRAVLMDAPPPWERVDPFIAIGRHLHGLGYGVPAIMATDTAQGFVLLEDLGDDTFTKLLAAGADEASLYRLATDVLADLHGRPEARAIDLPPYDRDAFDREVDLFVDWAAPALGLADSLSDPDSAPRRDWRAAWHAVYAPLWREPETLVLRDYHVDNLLRIAGREGLAACGLLDFQDALIGHPAYDLVSLLRDARRDVSPTLAREMRARYEAARPRAAAREFRDAYTVLGAQRTVKIIGIFTRLAHRDGKPRYLSHIPRLWRLLAEDLGDPALAPVADWMTTHVPPGRRGTPGEQPPQRSTARA